MFATEYAIDGNRSNIGATMHVLRTNFTLKSFDSNIPIHSKMIRFVRNIFIIRFFDFLFPRLFPMRFGRYTALWRIDCTTLVFIVTVVIARDGHHWLICELCGSYWFNYFIDISIVWPLGTFCNCYAIVLSCSRAIAGSPRWGGGMGWISWGGRSIRDNCWGLQSR